MEQSPAFFIPGVPAADEEEMYARMAAACSVGVPARGERIYSITFMSRGEEWTATVGEQLKGTKWERHKVRGETVERQAHLSDAAEILAIFPGYPFMVVRTSGRSAWENPFMAGTPESVIKFGHPSPESSGDTV